MSETAPDEIKILAKAPMIVAQKYSSYTINGFNFHTKSYDEGRCQGFKKRQTLGERQPMVEFFVIKRRLNVFCD